MKITEKQLRQLIKEELNNAKPVEALEELVANDHGIANATSVLSKAIMSFVERLAQSDIEDPDNVEDFVAETLEQVTVFEYTLRDMIVKTVRQCFNEFGMQA